MYLCILSHFFRALCGYNEFDVSNILQDSHHPQNGYYQCNHHRTVTIPINPRIKTQSTEQLFQGFYNFCPALKKLALDIHVNFCSVKWHHYVALSVSFHYVKKNQRRLQTLYDVARLLLRVPLEPWRNSTPVLMGQPSLRIKLMNLGPLRR